MHCPRCETGLVERERDGVLVDACPVCRGVWLDRGELEKLIARAQREDEAEERGFLGELGDDDDRDEWRAGQPRRRSAHSRRRRGWLESLGELFD